MIRGGVESSAAVAVLQHHQHFDGTGFPELRTSQGSCGRLDGTRIHVFARILGAADLFDRLANDSRRSARRANIEVLHLMRTRYMPWLDSEVFAAFAAAVPPFVPGTKVGLSDGTRAVVIGLNADDPYYPPVRRVADDGQALEKERIELASPDAPQIVAIGRLNVSQLVPERKHRKRACA
jgi:HD-GYP domain-containing protein (c-di-GMP phosphodiesterase class II)